VAFKEAVSAKLLRNKDLLSFGLVFGFRAIGLTGCLCQMWEYPALEPSAQERHGPVGAGPRGGPLK